MKHYRPLLLLTLLSLGLSTSATTMPFGRGTLNVITLAPNAVRIQYWEQTPHDDHPDWIYVDGANTAAADRTPLFSVTVDEPSGAADGASASGGTLRIADRQGRTLFTATSHDLRDGVATMSFQTAADESLFGLGQFQDGYANVRGLSRRLTQVNTQISVPMLLSSRGYGVLWNNYGLTDFNPCRDSVLLLPVAADGAVQAGVAGSGQETVSVTTTEGTRQETRRRNLFAATIDVAREGDYSLLLDVGQKMARRHNLTIDGKTVIEMQNVWLPPTASVIVHLAAGRHTLQAELTGGDRPVLFYDMVKPVTTFRSPVAAMVDYTVFVGTPDEIIASYRQLTGAAPLMPEWMMGYIHCRERFHSQGEILQTASRFRREQLPVDVLVQDWQYWGRHGWNAMRFDEQHYPDPKAMTDSLHRNHLRLMVSVWSKIDKNSEVGRQMLADGHYIAGTDWIDFFNPESARAYWQNFSRRLVPLGIDAWWQDATEPENDDLHGRHVNAGRWSGDRLRNVYPLLVCKTVFEGLSDYDASLPRASQKRPVILTRCGFPGIQRYGAALWSGDVGNDWETLRRQITAGLGLQAAGIPWWTYDAGGFFRPQQQYTDTAYHERLLRWVQTATFLPLMRVHGYMSNTEPWNYGETFQQAFALCLQQRYMLMPYIYSQAAAVAFEGSTLMRPLVFDFADDAEALGQKYEYMFGPALLVSPVVQPGVTQWPTYLPRTRGGWYEVHTARHYDGGQTVTTEARQFIPVFARAGSIVPMTSATKQYAADQPSAVLDVYVFPGRDAAFTLYEDDGQSRAYEQGCYSRIAFTWDDARQRLTIGSREGSYEGPNTLRTFRLHLADGQTKSVDYAGSKQTIDF